jgi:hypothetical protein
LTPPDASRSFSLARSSRSASIRLPATLTGSLLFYGKPGAYQLRLGAYSASLARNGSIYLSVDVPDFTAGNCQTVRPSF